MIQITAAFLLTIHSFNLLKFKSIKECTDRKIKDSLI